MSFHTEYMISYWKTERTRRILIRTRTHKFAANNHLHGIENDENIKIDASNSVVLVVNKLKQRCWYKQEKKQQKQPEKIEQTLDEETVEWVIMMKKLSIFPLNRWLFTQRILLMIKWVSEERRFFRKTNFKMFNFTTQVQKTEWLIILNAICTGFYRFQDDFVIYFAHASDWWWMWSKCIFWS